MPPARRILITPLVFFLTLTLAPLSAHAHGINIFATWEGDAVHGSVSIPGGAPLQKVMITAYGPDRRLLARTETDAGGRFVLSADGRHPLRLVAETPDGHRAELTLAASPQISGSAGSVPAESASGGGNGPSGTATIPAAAPDEHELALLIGKAVARELRPLREQLDREAHRRRLQDILGGLGYILGLAGLAMYGASRRKSGEKGE